MATPKKGDALPAANADGAAATEKKTKSTIKYPPYVNAYGSISKLFAEVTKASVPPKFTQDFLETVLGMKSSSHRALIPLLKKLHFLDAAQVPTEAYKNFREHSQSGAVMAAQIKAAYPDIYRANEYAHNLKKEELQSKLRTLLGAAEDDPTVPAVVATFMELTKLANFKASSAPAPIAKQPDAETEKRRELGDTGERRMQLGNVGLSYTINLNLPATTEIEVFNAIFKSLKEHLLDG